MHRTHWHAVRMDTSVSREDKRSVTLLGSLEGFGTYAHANGVVEADKGSHGQQAKFCEWFTYPCGCESGTRHWSRVDMAVYANLNS